MNYFLRLTSSAYIATVSITRLVKFRAQSTHWNVQALCRWNQRTTVKETMNKEAIDSDPVDKDGESEKGCRKYRRSGATS